MSAKRLPVAALLAAALLAGQTALADDGRALYRQHCAKCHGDEGRGNTWRGWLFRAENLSDRTWQDKRSDAEILHAIDKGPGAMPAYRESLTEEQRAALVQVVRALGHP